MKFPAPPLPRHGRGSVWRFAWAGFTDVGSGVVDAPGRGVTSVNTPSFESVLGVYQLPAPPKSRGLITPALVGKWKMGNDEPVEVGKWGIVVFSLNDAL